MSRRGIVHCERNNHDDATFIWKENFRFAGKFHHSPIESQPVLRCKNGVEIELVQWHWNPSNPRKVETRPDTRHKMRLVRV